VNVYAEELKTLDNTSQKLASAIGSPLDYKTSDLILRNYFIAWQDMAWKDLTLTTCIIE